MADDPLDHYLDYLDKEMTIMGLLSTFAVGVVAALLSTLTELKPDTLSGKMWTEAISPLSASIILALFAAYLFYQQRAHLAWHYGYITYHLARHQRAEAMESPDELQDLKGEWRSYLHGLNILAVSLLTVVTAFWYTRTNRPSPQAWHGTAAAIVLLLAMTVRLELRIRADRIGVRRGKHGNKAERSISMPPGA